MGLIFKITTKTWFDREIRFSFSLMNSFIQNTEDQIKTSWENYLQNKEVVLEDDSEVPIFFEVHINLMNYFLIFSLLKCFSF
jgi:hypothetical protein